MSGSRFDGEVTKQNMHQVYDHLGKITSSKSFLSNQGLNNEVPFHICPYNPTIHEDFSQLLRQLVKHLEQQGIQVLPIDLYDFVIDILRREDDWNWLIENETTMSKAEFKEELQGVLDVESVITPAISARMAESDFDVLFLTGVGEVFPYIRSHNILNNLQKTAKDKPTLLFFPGVYQHSLEKGASLNLFGRVSDDKYYRAFNILDRAI